MHCERWISEWQTSTKPAVYDCTLLDKSNQSITSACTQQYLKEPHLTMMCNCAYSILKDVSRYHQVWIHIPKLRGKSSELYSIHGMHAETDSVATILVA